MFKLISSVSAETSKLEKGILKFTDRLVELIINPLIVLFTGMSVILFFWGLVMFLLTQDSTKKENGKRHMFFGVVGMFLIFGVWSIMFLIEATVSAFGS